MSARLHDLLDGIADAHAFGELAVSGLTLDSRQVRPGEAFLALQGTQGHGIAFATEAVRRGACVVLAETPAPMHSFPPLAGEGAADGWGQSPDAIQDVPLLRIEQLHARVGEIAARFYDQPSKSMRVIGVTGTNGKTSTVQMLAQALTLLGHRPATIGTLGAGMHGALREGERTTPDAVSVQASLAEFRQAGASHVAMEVSSHALQQDRVAAVDFEVAAFTNLTRDHLDYHGSMQVYGAAKARLFAMPGLRAAVINTEDAFGRELLAQLPIGVHPLRLSSDEAVADAADVVASAIETSTNGLSFDLRTPWGDQRIHSALLGRFNVANLLTVVACLGALGEPFARIIDAVQALQPVNGRMSRLGGGSGEPLVVVDYAHTPDALEQALAAARAHCAGRLICVFGCGGERDAGKRPLMGAIAERLADVAIVTDDNPRGEDGDAIVATILAGMRQSQAVSVQRDRAAAIGQAIAQARSNDVVLVAGKGHETYQEGVDGKRAFDDQAVARAALDQLARERRA